MSEQEIPRRIRVDLMTPAELAILEAVRVVEEAGCHPFLTDAVMLLQEARDKVADFVDSAAIPPDAPAPPPRRTFRAKVTGRQVRRPLSFDE